MATSPMVTARNVAELLRKKRKSKIKKGRSPNNKAKKKATTI